MNVNNILLPEDKSVRIGCQRFNRFEMEQIAVKLGFKGQKFGLTPVLKRG